jgi:hypothetical protein
LENKIVPVVKDFIHQIFACLSEKETNELDTLVRRLRIHVEAMD